MDGMRRRRFRGACMLICRLIILALSSVWAMAVWAADFSDYKPTSLAKAWSEALVIKEADYTIEVLNIKYVVDGSYTGQHREVGKDRRELLRRWAKSLNHPPHFADMFEHEIAIDANKKIYWLALQNSLVQPFAAEAKTGSMVRLHIMYIGAVGEERLFVVNRFEVLSH